jgi:cell division protein FtsQ
LAISILQRADATWSSVRDSWRTLGGRRIAVLAGFVLITIAGALLALSRSPLFGIRDIEVRGTERLSADRIRALADVDPSGDLLWLNLAEVESHIEREPWIAGATVERVLPWTLVIRVKEQTAVAVVRTPAGDALVAADGTLLGRARPRVDLPRLVVPAAQLIRGQSPSAAVSSLARVVRWLPDAIRRSVESLGLYTDGSVVLQIAGGPAVEFGAVDDLRAKAQSLRRVLSWVQRQRVEVGEISLVSPGAPAVSLSA